MNKLKVKKDELLSLLQLLKDARNKLLSDFYEENPSIFVPIYKYEDDDNMMNVSVEYYILEWINFHFALFSRSCNAASAEYLSFIKIMSSLFDNRMAKEKDAVVNDSGFIFELMQDKQKLLNKIFELNDKSEINYRKLLHSSIKDKALFRRKFETLQGEK